MSSQGFRFKPLPINRTYGRHQGKTMVVIGCSASLDEVDLSLVEKFPKISIHRALRAIECEYLVISDPEVFHAVRPDIAKKYAGRWPQMLMWMNVLQGYRKYGINLEGKRYYEMRLEWRDEWKNARGYFQRAQMDPANPYGKYYLRGHNKPTRATDPGAFQLDGPFLRSHSTAIYATEWAFRMVAGEAPSRIILLGVDFRSKQIGSKDLTYMRHVDTNDQRDRKCKLVVCDLAVPQLGRAHRNLKRHGVELVNCSPWEGPLDEFIPRKDLGETVGSTSVPVSGLLGIRKDRRE